MRTSIQTNNSTISFRHWKDSFQFCTNQSGNIVQHSENIFSQSETVFLLSSCEFGLALDSLGTFSHYPKLHAVMSVRQKVFPLCCRMSRHFLVLSKFCSAQRRSDGLFLFQFCLRLSPPYSFFNLLFVLL